MQFMDRYSWAGFGAVLLLLAPLSAAAQTQFSDATLDGVYVYSLQGSNYRHASGILIADGNGSISGTRNAVNVPHANGIFFQQVTGTYDVFPDGTGTAFLDLDPPAPDGGNFIQLRFALVNEDEFDFAGHETGGGAGYGTVGTAKRQRAADEVAQIEARLERLEALACETVRLLNTPQGLRASDCCEEPVSFPDGKDAPTCGGAVVNPAPAPDPLQLPAAPRPGR